MGNVCSVREDSPRETAGRYEHYTAVWHEVIAKLSDEPALLRECSTVYQDECARRNRRQLTKQIWQDVTTAFVARISCDDPRTKERIYRSVDTLYLGPGDRTISEAAFAEFTRLSLELAERDLRDRIGKIQEKYGGPPPSSSPSEGRGGCGGCGLGLPPLPPAPAPNSFFRSAPPGAFGAGGSNGYGAGPVPERSPTGGGWEQPARRTGYEDHGYQQQQQQQQRPAQYQQPPPHPQEQESQRPWWVAQAAPPQPQQERYPSRGMYDSFVSPQGQQSPMGAAAPPYAFGAQPPRVPPQGAGGSPGGGAGACGGGLGNGYLGLGGNQQREASPPRLQLPRSAQRLQELQRQQAEQERSAQQQRVQRPPAVVEEPLPPGYEEPVKPHEAGAAAGGDDGTAPAPDGAQPPGAGLDPAAPGASLPSLRGGEGSPEGPVTAFPSERIYEMQRHILCGNLRVYVFNKNLELQAKRLAVNPSAKRISILRDDGLCEDSWEIDSLISISRHIDATILAEPPPPGAAAFRFKFEEGDTDDRFLCVVFESEETSRLATEAFGLLCEVPVAPG